MVKKSIIYVAFLFLLNVMPLGNFAELHKIFVLQFRADHIFHAALFLPWGYFCSKMNKYLPLWFFLGILLTAGSEGLQYFLPYRSFNISDMLANAIGAATGFILCVPLLRLKKMNALKSEGKEAAVS